MIIIKITIIIDINIITAPAIIRERNNILEFLSGAIKSVLVASEKKKTLDNLIKPIII